MNNSSKLKLELQQTMGCHWLCQSLSPTRTHWRSQRHPTVLRSLLLVCLSLTLVANLSAEPPEPEEPQPAKNEPAEPGKTAPSALDQQLLEGLGERLLDDLPDLVLGEPAGKKPNEGDTPGPPKGQDIEGLAGEDLGQAGESNDPLTRIGQRMRKVENRIAQQDASKDTQTLQEQIIADLDEMIKQAQQQQKSQSKSSASKKPPGSQRSKVKQPGQQQAGNKPGDGAGQTSQKPASDSSDRLGPDEMREVNMDQMRDLIKDVWGNLPDRMREQMNQDAVEEFLPKYRLQIEEYFRRLAEEPAENR